MDVALLLLLPVLLPIAAAFPVILCNTLRRPRPLRCYLYAVLSLNAAVVLTIVLLPQMELQLLQFSPTLILSLRSDRLACFFCSLSSAIFFLVGIYAPAYMRHEENERRFYLFYLIVLGMLGGIGLSANLLTLYLFFEIMTLCSMPLVLHTLTKEAIGAAFKYVFYSIAGASLGLLGLFFIHTYGGTLAFVPGGALNAAALTGNETVLQIVTLLSIIGFGAKAGLFPLHAWLPTAHPVAPAPASAILSGVITKAGVFAVFRFVFYSVGADRIRGSWVQSAWMVLTLITILMGSILAFKEPLLKKRMAYSSVSQVSYILLGLSTLNAGGMLGALLHVVFHSAAKSAFFLIAGAMIIRSGKTKVAELAGIGRQMPVTLWAFTVVAVSMIGIPPAGGFLSKWYLATGALASGTGVLSWLGPVILLFSALLTAGYLLSITIRGFFPDPGVHCNPEGREAAPAMLVPIGLLAAAGIVLGIVPGGLTAFFQQIIAAVL